MFWTSYGFGYLVIRIASAAYGILLTMMRGNVEPVKKVEEEDTKAKKVPIGQFDFSIFNFAFNTYFVIIFLPNQLHTYKTSLGRRLRIGHNSYISLDGGIYTLKCPQFIA